MSAPELSWLPQQSNWHDALKTLPAVASDSAWEQLVALARTKLDMLGTVQLDKRLQKLFGETPPDGLQTRPVRLAVLGSSTLDYLSAGIRVGALRRNIWVNVYKSNYGQYVQELHSPDSALHAWKPDTILFAFDSRHLLGTYQVGESVEAVKARVDAATAHVAELWRAARKRFGCQIIQQAALPVYPRIFGENESLSGSAPAVLIDCINERLRRLAQEEGVAMLAVDRWAMEDGLSAWHDPVLWYRAKQEVHMAAMPMYGDIVGRLLAAQQGRSAKCLVLDLDNTLWGGVIGDDCLEGIVLGQGSALGEAFCAFQQYAKDLSRRGIILAVCSKNDKNNALLPFDQHSDMVLRRDDIACFSASWDDKATAIRSIAKQLNIGLDAMVFADDNPFERNIVRRELPMVAVPELPADPSLFPSMLSRAGYFESVSITAEDLARTQQYQENAKRDSARENATDMQSYLQSLNMTLHWSPFTAVDQNRVVQLINKTNQFNLTTRRYSSEEIASLLDDPSSLTMQVRLADKFGDNGIISIVIGRLIENSTVEVDTWLMSCRVLGRRVEQTVLNILVDEARKMGASRLLGHYRPTEKNNMVADHYQRLGFNTLPGGTDAPSRFELQLENYTPLPNFIQIMELDNV